MHIVGGLYRELCDIPFWDSTMGSGGRAAMASINLSPGSEFYTYASPADNAAILALQSRGVITNTVSRHSSIVFAYFHPLSYPHVEPPRETLSRLPALQVKGEAVLRFGFLEGDAIVTADRAVYDPQTWRNPQPFSANGSTAGELALVLNELELREAAGIVNLDHAALHLINEASAQVVIVKKGACGATIYDAEGNVSHVPAYRSNKIFKIGTGDIFSTVFAVYWAERKMPAIQAADLASRSVSLYCETRKFEFDPLSLSQRVPVAARVGARICIEGGTESIGQRYTLEEARFALRELGMEVICPENEQEVGVLNVDATLVINDDLSPQALIRIRKCQVEGKPVVVLHEQSNTTISLTKDIEATDDFASAIYLAAWAAGKA
ncbi:PfkB family carbohydrate kinase [Pantoea deleyi]|uniref:PfkB family carbohydrate kinase n=1 Tax=Pantoea deleyi TaxID=470932 RepID=UPI0035D3DF39